MTNQIINIFRSPITSCWDGDLDSGVDRIDDRELEEIADQGYNGIWLHQPLRDFTPSRIFPEFGAKREKHLPLLESLVRRAQRHGIRVFLYLLEPRALQSRDPFWRSHPELRGQYFYQEGYESEYFALCSSQPRVREYLRDSLRLLSARVDLDYFCITAGEDFNTCLGKLCSSEYAQKAYPGFAAHERKLAPEKNVSRNNSCPLCSRRNASEVIAELVNTLHEGIGEGNPSARLLAWDWGWRKLPWPGTEKEILDRLHEEIIYISDFEIGGQPGGESAKFGIYEYSLSYVGPSENFTELTAHARRRGLQTGAKLQVGTTHELATVPNLPVIRNLWEKISRARKLGLRAAIATWNLGTCRTLNTWLFGQAFSAEKVPSWEEFVRQACRYLEAPESLGPELTRAWDCFGKAMEAFPYSTPLLYFGPMNYAPSFWLPPAQTSGKFMGISCAIWERGDDLDFCLGPYTLEETVSAFEQLTSRWEEGLAHYEKVRAALPRSERFAEEYNSAACVRHVYLSTLNVFKAYRLCRRWREEFFDEYLSICRDELANCQALLPLLERDPRLGVHLECKASMFDFKSVTAKVNRLRQCLATTSPTPAQT